MKYRHRMPLQNENISESLSSFRMPGRFQVLDRDVPIVLDVAHNPQAMENLRNNLGKMPAANSTYIVVGFLNDKDYSSMLRIIRDCGDFWYVVTLQDDRKLDGGTLEEELKNMGVSGNVCIFDNVSEAMKQADKLSRPGDRIIVTGSFVTVGNAITWINSGS